MLSYANIYSMDQLLINIVLLLIIIILYVFSGIALWKASNFKQKKWFTTVFIFSIHPLILIQTLGIVTWIYLFKFSKKPLTLKELQSWLPTTTKK